MRLAIRATLALAGMLVLGACNLSQIQTGITVGTQLLPLITTDINAALTSSKVLVQQAATLAPSTAPTAAKVQARIDSVAAKIASGVPIVATDLNALNSVTAALLNAAGQIGVKLPGLTS